jgi:uncharacterized membrane protein
MNSELLDQISHQMGANGLPYAIPIHPNLVHLTLGLFIIAIIFDLLGVFFPLEKWLFKFLGIKVERSRLFDVGWYNIFAAAVITFFTVGAGFYEMLLAAPPADIKSPWGMLAMPTMMWHGVGGVLLLALIVGMTFWRGWQRYVIGKYEEREVQISYLVVGVIIMLLMYFHGTLGAHLAADFGVHNTADKLLRAGQDISNCWALSSSCCLHTRTSGLVIAVIFPVSISVRSAINKSRSDVGPRPNIFLVKTLESEVSTGTCPGNWSSIEGGASRSRVASNSKISQINLA